MLCANVVANTVCAVCWMRVCCIVQTGCIVIILPTDCVATGTTVVSIRKLILLLNYYCTVVPQYYIYTVRRECGPEGWLYGMENKVFLID